MAENASLFLAYGELQNVVRRIYAQPLPEKLSMAQLAVAAAGAGAITSFVLYVPRDFIEPIINSCLEIHLFSLTCLGPQSSS